MHCTFCGSLVVDQEQACPRCLPVAGDCRAPETAGLLAERFNLPAIAREAPGAP